MYINIYNMSCHVCMYILLCVGGSKGKSVQVCFIFHKLQGYWVEHKLEVTKLICYCVCFTTAHSRKGQLHFCIPTLHYR